MSDFSENPNPPADSSQYPPPPPQPDTKTPLREALPILIVAAVALVVILAVGAVVIVRSGDPKPDLSAVAEKALHGASNAVTHSGDAKTETVKWSGASASDETAITTYLNDLGFSDAVWERMIRTRAVDGTQTADSSKSVHASWTYDSDSLDIVLEAR